MPHDNKFPIRPNKRIFPFNVDMISDEFCIYFDYFAYPFSGSVMRSFVACIFLWTHEHTHTLYSMKMYLHTNRSPLNINTRGTRPFLFSFFFAHSPSSVFVLAKERVVVVAVDILFVWQFFQFFSHSLTLRCIIVVVMFSTIFVCTFLAFFWYFFKLIENADMKLR